MAEVGLAEAALVGLAALEVAGQAAAAGLAAAKAKRQLVLHRKSCSFYTEVTFICLCLLLFLFTTHKCPTFFVV